MFDIKELAQLFSQVPTLQGQEESFSMYKAHFLLSNRNPVLDGERVAAFIQRLTSTGDKFVVTCSVDGSDSDDLVLGSDIVSKEQVQSKWTTFLQSIDDDENAILTILVNKKNPKIARIYSLDSMEKYIQESNLSTLIHLFDELITTKGFVTVYDQEILGGGDYLRFLPCDTDGALDRLLPPRAEAFHYSNMRGLQDIQSDIQAFGMTEPTGTLFDAILHNIECLLSLATMCSGATIHDDTVELTLKGMRTIQGCIDAPDLQFDDNCPLPRIYRWLSSGYSREDKLGIVRNVLSIGCSNIDDLLTVKQPIFDSILSSFDIYLKENVKQYLDVKNTLTDRLLGLIQEASAGARAMADSLKKNYFAFLSYFFTAVIINGIQSSDLTDIFTDQMTLIAYGLVGISFLMMIYSVIEVISGWKRQLRNIEILREEYSDILNSEDLKNIFERHSLIRDQRCRLVKNTFLISALWLITLAALFTLAYIGNRTLGMELESPVYL